MANARQASFAAGAGKEEARRAVRQALKAASERSLSAQSEEIAKGIERSCVFASANKIGMYVSLPKLREVDTRGIINRLLERA